MFFIAGQSRCWEMLGHMQPYMAHRKSPPKEEHISAQNTLNRKQLANMMDTHTPLPASLLTAFWKITAA